MTQQVKVLFTQPDSPEFDPEGPHVGKRKRKNVSSLLSFDLHTYACRKHEGMHTCAQIHKYTHTYLLSK